MFPRQTKSTRMTRDPNVRAMDLGLEGKVCVVTGASRGIGKATATRLCDEGAKVLFVARSAKEVASEADRCGGDWLAVDVTDPEAPDRIVATCAEQMGGIDILVNNAALFDLAPIVEITRESYDRLFSVNVAGTLLTLQAAARSMIARGKGGRIINMASQAGRRGEALVGVYCATKAAVISLTQSAGLDLIRHGINVNAIAPGVVDGEHWEHVDALFARHEKRPLGEKKRLVGEAVPYGRMGTASDLTGMAIFLAGPESDYVVAQTYNVDGGNWMS
jgi:NAD(P)-dependent dehydrogenase (short-subunit alcohol dehydrogenase family)